jgi:hypothetical protein
MPIADAFVKGKKIILKMLVYLFHQQGGFLRRISSEL